MGEEFEVKSIDYVAVILIKESLSISEHSLDIQCKILANNTKMMKCLQR